MFSSNDKLIDEVRKRLIAINKKKPIKNYPRNTLKYIEVKRLSTLMPRKSSEGNRGSIKRKSTINYLIEDKINLRLVPLIRSEKAIMKLEKVNNIKKRFKTEPYNMNSQRNIFDPKTPNKDYKSYLYMKTISNILTISNSFGKPRTNANKNLFLSPFDEGKKRKKVFKILVDFSKEIHSPKHKENILINNIFNIKSLSPFEKSKMKNNITINPYMQKELIKKFKIKKNILVKNKKDNNKDNDNNSKEKKKIKLLLKRLKNCNEVLKNKIQNKNKYLKPNCYYNKLHLIKMNDIFDKFSFNNID